MNKATRSRLIIDLLLMLLIVILAAAEYLPLGLHERMGLGIALILLGHCYINRHSLTKGIGHLVHRRLGRRQRFRILCNYTLLIVFLLAVVSGLAIARTLGSWQLPEQWIEVHCISGNLAIIGALIHLFNRRKWLKNVIKPKKLSKQIPAAMHSPTKTN